MKAIQLTPEYISRAEGSIAIYRQKIERELRSEFPNYKIVNQYKKNIEQIQELLDKGEFIFYRR